MNDGIIRLIQSDSYKDRLKGEYLELTERLVKLKAFLNVVDDDFLASTSKSLLMQQFEVMKEYRHILKKRADIEGIQVEYVECSIEDLKED